MARAGWLVASLAALLLGCSSTSSSADGGTCSACTQAGSAFSSCPAEVATNKMTVCQALGSACCLGGKQWHCGFCLAETCYWEEACTPAGFDAGGRCSDTISCPGDEVCISGGTCAPWCTTFDGGTACPAGTTCQSATDYFNPALVSVCL